MALGFARFVGDRRGTTFEGIALSVAVIAVAFVASADMLDYLVKKHGDAATPSATPAAVASNSRPAAITNLDMSPTASLPRLVSRSVLDPCTGIVK